MLNYICMGFKENLKDELKYQGVLVKELSEKTGIPKGTIDHYLAEKNTAPIAENAVKIAQALNVSVEFLVTGENKGFPSMPANSSRLLKPMIEKLCRMNEKQLRFVNGMLDLVENEIVEK